MDMFIGACEARGEQSSSAGPADRIGPRRSGGARGVGDRRRQGNRRRSMPTETARVGLGRISPSAATEARQTLMPLLPDPEAEGLLAGLEVASWAGLSEPGTLASAKRLAAQGKWREGLDGMIGALGDDPDARQAMLEVFAVLGEEHELVPEYRRRWRTRCSETTGSRTMADVGTIRSGGTGTHRRMTRRNPRDPRPARGGRVTGLEGAGRAAGRVLDVGAGPARYPLLAARSAIA
jgi:hypothetical protein